MEDEADQFLSLIGENAQIKAEILSLRKYDKAIRTLDRNSMKIFTNEVLGVEKSPAEMNTLISEVRIGVTPVESAESFKERMKAERIKKICEAQRAKMEELKQKVEHSEKRKRDLESSIESLQTKITEHEKIIKEAVIENTINLGFSADIIESHNLSISHSS